jgi:hypothetical protein
MAGTYIHGGQPGFTMSFNAVLLCQESVDVTMSREIIEARTNCGLTNTPGPVSTEWSGSGPLGFGAGSDEATLYAHMIATTAVAAVFHPSTAAVGPGNPYYTGSVYGTQFKISATPTGNVMGSWSAMENNTTGYPTRTTA